MQSIGANSSRRQKKTDKSLRKKASIYDLNNDMYSKFHFIMPPLITAANCAKAELLSLKRKRREIRRRQKAAEAKMAELNQPNKEANLSKSV